MNRNFMRSSSNWTGRTARTMCEAFGPMAGDLLGTAQRNESQRTARAIQYITACAVAALIVVGVFALTA